MVIAALGLGYAQAMARRNGTRGYCVAGNGDFLIHDSDRPYKGFLNIDEVEFSFRQFDGSMGARQVHQIMEAGDSVAVLAYNRDQAKVILVRQFRIATALRQRPGDGWLFEIPAGGIGKDETPLMAARRELFEETGYDLRRDEQENSNKRLERFEHIATIYPSPGRSTERIFVYYVEVQNHEKTGPEGGNKAEGEDIETFHMWPDELLRGIDDNTFKDAKLIIAAQWFRNAGMQRKVDLPNKANEKIRYTFSWTGKFDSENLPVIGFKLGDIGDVHGVDIWVNSENTDMLMDRFFGKSLSSRIRYLGAEKSADGTIHVDTVADELHTQRGGQFFIKPAHNLVTGPGSLGKPPHKVRKIIHAASVQGSPGRNLYSVPEVSAESVERALLRVERLNADRGWHERPYASILVPMLGGGMGGLKPPTIAKAIVPSVINFLSSSPATELKQIFFLAYRDSDMRLLEGQLDKYTEGAGKLLQRLPGSGP